VRLLIALIVIVYLVGVGVELAPIFQTGWAHQTASELTSNIIDALPNALAWPVQVYRNFTGKPAATT
jgi:hypothetical protein